MQENNKPPEPEKKSRRRVKKVKGHGGHHGGAWKVAYADFVTAMMALFLVLWLVSQADTKLKKQIANYFRSPGVFTSSKGGILSGERKVSREPGKLTAEEDEMALIKVADNLKQKLESSEKFKKTKDKVHVIVTEDGLQIQVMDEADNVSFPVGSSELKNEAREILAEIAEAICELPNPIIIGGHTDARDFPSSNGYTNWELSTDRANAARRVLQQVCVKPEQIRRIIGYADTDPIIERDHYAPQNRRISISVLRLNYGENIGKEESESEESSENKDKTNIDSKELNFVEKPKRRPTRKTRKAEAEEKSLKKETKPKKESKEKKETEKPEVKKDEKKTLEEKLKEKGLVRVGKPDEVPKKSKSREPKLENP